MNEVLIDFLRHMNSDFDLGLPEDGFEEYVYLYIKEKSANID